jgi:hypothetical protein
VAPPKSAVTVCPPASEAVQELSRQEPSGATENAAKAVTSPVELPYTSRPSAVKSCESPAEIVADAGERTRWSRTAAVTSSAYVPVAVPEVPVTVCGPATVAVQVAPEHDPFGEIVKVVPAVTSPVELSNRSRPLASNVADPPAAIDDVSVFSARWSSAAGLTKSEVLLVAPAFSARTVCGQAGVAVQTLRVHDPSGVIEKWVVDVTSPSEFPSASKPSTV